MEKTDGDPAFGAGCFRLSVTAHEGRANEDDVADYVADYLKSASLFSRLLRKVSC